ncbi:M56 family metallopeptidase [uncultured Alistipes sp.]|uniref:M56 family metallopeptidase n=1 Tax=uncultured Alistipes sp. TaxID=538949 RepID=UPI0026121D54|nr:M56 family metallopeptidase [uncultured Alistipes sp.]
MQTFLPYLLKAAACLAVFWTFFRVMLSRTTLYRFNRLVLLAGTALAMLLPLCVITRYREIPVMPELPQVVFAAPAPEVSAPAFSWQTVAAVLFGAGAVATGLHTLWSLGCVARLVGRGRRERLTDGVVLVRTSRAVSPFSWGRYIVLPERLEAADEASILLHERAHLRLGHTFDLLWMDAVCLLQWFNPAVWLLRRELREVHEYEADAAVLAAGADARAYQMLLIKEAAGGRWYSVANSFNHSKLKNRITMMLRKRSSRWAGARALLLLPLVGVALGAFAETRYVISDDKDKKENVTVRIERSKRSTAEARDKLQFWADTVCVEGSKLLISGAQDDPLVLVNGKPVSSLDEVPVDQVKSITVIKDSVAAVKYGPKAVHGVVLIDLGKDPEEFPQSMARLGIQAGDAGLMAAVAALKATRDQIPEEEYAEAMEKIRAARAEMKTSMERGEWLRLRDSSYFDSAEWKEAQKKLEAVGDYFDSDEWKEAQKKLEAVGEYFDSEEWQEAQRKMETLDKFSDQLSGRIDAAVVPSSGSHIIIGNASVGKDTFAGMKIYIDGEEASSEEVDRLEPEKIRSVEVCTGKKAVRRYGEQAAEGVVKIKTRK